MGPRELTQEGRGCLWRQAERRDVDRIADRWKRECGVAVRLNCVVKERKCPPPRLR